MRISYLMIILLFINILACNGNGEFQIAQAAPGTTYYVDATAGNDINTGTTADNAWKTISKVNTSSFSPGDIVLFKRGETWAEQLTVPNSGTSTYPITFSNYGAGALPEITGSHTREKCIFGSSKNYIIIDGFSVTGFTFQGIHNYSGINWIIRNNIVTGGVNATEKTGILSEGTSGFHARNVTISYNTINQIGKNYNVLSNPYSGILAYYTDNTLIANNSVSPAKCTGISVIGYNGNQSIAATIRSNNVTNYYGVGIIVKEVTGPVDIGNNHVYNGVGSGIAVNFNVTGAKIYYNLIHNITGIPNGSQNGIDINESCVNGTIYNNTVYNVPVYNLTLESGVGGWTIKNNIFDSRSNTENAPNTGQYCILQTAESGYTNSFDHNLYFTTVNGKIALAGLKTYNLSEWQAQLTTWGVAGTDAHSLNTDPIFVNAPGGNFYLSPSSPAIDAGTNVSLTTDYSGISVPFGIRPDIGAIEYQ